MDEDLINKMHFSFQNHLQSFTLPHCIYEAFNVSAKYFQNYSNNKLCIVFPAKENSAQWLTFLTALDLIYKDFEKFKREIFESYKQYRTGQLLILNNEAIVKWVGYDNKYIKFSTKPEGKGDAPTRFANHIDVIKLQPAPVTRKALSVYSRVVKALNMSEKYPIDKLFGFYSAGNRQFIKSAVCLVDRFKDYDNVLSNILLNQHTLKEYISAEKIMDDGSLNNFSSLLLSNNLERIIYNTEKGSYIKLIVIDGINQIEDALSNFNDVDTKNIQTVLLTDLTETESFEKVSNLGFGFFNFSKNNIRINPTVKQSPFYYFEKKLLGFHSFESKTIVCHNPKLEQIVWLLHSLNGNEVNDDYTKIRNSLVKLTNSLARICHSPTQDEILKISNILDGISSKYQTNRLWFGDSSKVLEEILLNLGRFINDLLYDRTDKCIKLEKLLWENFDYIICYNDEESKLLKSYLKSVPINVISLADINENLFSLKNQKAVITGWLKSVNLNKILHSFIFTEITFLFYAFENTYHASLQRKNRNFVNSVEYIIDNNGVRQKNESNTINNYDNMYGYDQKPEDKFVHPIDISAFELKIENTQFSKYYATGNPDESCKARRIDFKNNGFIYAMETHKFLVINELLDSTKSDPSIFYKKIETLKTGDIIALINTDKDILAETVRNSAGMVEYEKIKNLIELWKNLLQKKYAQFGYNFRTLVKTLNNHGCKRHEATIRTWLTDENMIGPESDTDLLVIGRMTNSEYLLKNIKEVREAIKIMTGWRMRAAEVIREKIRNKILGIADKTVINSYIEIQDLGRVEFLKVCEIKREVEEIDKKYVHRLIAKDII